MLVREAGEMPLEPSPFATHADLSAMRREIQLDVRGEMRDFTNEIRHTLRTMEAKSITAKQWAITTLLSVANLVTVFYFVGH